MASDNRISRRDFLKVLGAGTAIVTLGGLTGISDILITKNRNGFHNKLPQQEQLAYGQQQGTWSAGANTTTTPIHVALLHTGKIFYLAGSGWDYNRQSGPFEARVRDLDTGAEKSLTQTEDLFCAGQTTLADGTILLAGGTLLYDQNPDNCNGEWHGLNAAYEFNPTSESFTKVQNMLHGRWYPTLVTLADGQVWCYNGYDEYGENNRLVERYDPASKTWTRIASGGTLTYTVGLGDETTCPGPHPVYQQAGPTTSFYPRAHLMPSGLLITTGFRTEVRSWSPSTGAWALLGNASITRHYGTSFLLPLQNTTTEKGKILVCGGSTTSTTVATTQAQVLDFNTGNPTIRTVASTAFARKYMSPVILPNGKCVIFGGTQEGNINPVLTPEQFDPVTETWQSLPPSTIARYYHSSALLLPDGRVWVAGGTRNSAPTTPWELRTEFFSPSYMSQTRPTITTAPTVGAYGGTITISTPSPATVTSVSLLRLMNTTHHYEANQRLVWLQILSRGSSSVTVSAPINASIAPPGYYLIHVLINDIPSIGRIIKIPGTDAPPADTTPPSQVAGLAATTVNSSQIDLSWAANPVPDGVDHYNVYRGTTAGFPVTPGTTPTLATPTTNTYSNTGLTGSTTYYYKVAAVDAAGNIGTLSTESSATTSAAPDTTIPNVAITSPTTGSTLPPGNITVTGTASDNTGGSGVRDVRVRVDSGAYVAATPAAPGDWSTWSRTVSITAEGAHTIAANVRDNAGNFRTIGINVTVSSAPPAPDTTIPNVAITSPTTGSTFPPGNITVTGTASDNTGGSGVRDVRVRVDSGAYVAATPVAPGDWSTWSRTVTINTTGSHVIAANVRDNAGNFRTIGVNITIT
jgi:hypothetical protein